METVQENEKKETQGLPVKQIIRETLKLTQTETIDRKWMYENAARILKAF